MTFTISKDFAHLLPTGSSDEPKLDYYLSLEPKYHGKSMMGNYPVVRLGDLLIEAVHYKSIDDFKACWERRISRINRKKLFLIFTDRDGFSTDLLPRIAALPYKKVLFSHAYYGEYDFVQIVPGFENEVQVGSLTEFKRGITGKRLYSIYPFAKQFMKMAKEKNA